MVSSGVQIGAGRCGRFVRIHPADQPARRRIPLWETKLRSQNTVVKRGKRDFLPVFNRPTARRILG
jgi:hypothetical protein